MMDVAGSLTLGTILVVVLVVWRKAALAAQDLPYGWKLLGGENEPCPQEFVERIFSNDDAEFIQSMQSNQLKSFFLRERKSVALLWVRQNSQRIGGILREHTAAARHSDNLHFVTELAIFLRYLYLRALCGLLFAAIALAGPNWVGGLALRADALFQRFAGIRASLKTASEAPQFSTGNSL
jgi:hypothetical protein